MNKYKYLWVLLLLLAIPVTGCGPKVTGGMMQIGSTPNNNYYAAMAAATNERGPAATAVSIIAEQKYPGWQQTVITGGNAPQNQPTASQPVAKREAPKHSVRGKQALICPPTPAPPPAKPIPAQPTVITTTTSPQTMVVGGAGGTGPSTLQTGLNALISGGTMAAGMMGGAALLRPARTAISQTTSGVSSAATGPISNEQGQTSFNNNLNKNALTGTNTNTNNATGIGTASAASD